MPAPQEAAVFRQKGGDYVKGLAMVQDRGAWEEALAIAADRTGLSPAAPARPFVVRLALETSRYMDNNHYLAYAGWKGAEGFAKVAMDRLTEQVRRPGWGRSRFVSVAAHELTHCLQGYLGPRVWSNPPWLIEGMASYVADERGW